jgi:hypothetical protein
MTGVGLKPTPVFRFGLSDPFLASVASPLPCLMLFLDD